MWEECLIYFLLGCFAWPFTFTSWEKLAHIIKLFSLCGTVVSLILWKFGYIIIFTHYRKFLGRGVQNYLENCKNSNMQKSVYAVHYLAGILHINKLNMYVCILFFSLGRHCLYTTLINRISKPMSRIHVNTSPPTDSPIQLPTTFPQ